MSTRIVEQIWRVVRLFGVSFGGAITAGVPDEKAALIAIGVGTFEGVYRAIFPAGNQRLLLLIAKLITQAAEQQPTAVVTPPPTSVVNVQVPAGSVVATAAEVPPV